MTGGNLQEVLHQNRMELQAEQYFFLVPGTGRKITNFGIFA